MRPQSTGAISTATWLARAAGDDPRERVHAVHVIPPDVLAEIRRDNDEQTVRGAFAQHGGELLRAPVLKAHLHDPEILAGEIVPTLEAEALRRGSDALVISRRAPNRGSLHVPRLGKIARRLLRSLKLPVIVCPPDLIASELGDGPVVVAVDFTPASTKALHFGKKLADAIGRELLITHFAQLPDQLDYVGFVSATRWQAMCSEIHEDAEEQMAQFLRAHEVDDVLGVRWTVSGGAVISGLLEVCERSKACALVTGSGHHGLLHRMIVPSVASEVASLSKIPVAVVG